MPLSEEDRCDIALRHGKDIHNPHVLAVANASYALGAERARKVRALAWREPEYEPGGATWRESKENPSGRRYSCHKDNASPMYYTMWAGGMLDAEDTEYPSLEAAKAACQAHHAARVLSMLEDV